jgi:uncharacterized membrane protein
MHKLSEFEMISGMCVLIFAIVLIVCMIAAGFKIAADARVEDEQKKCERRARQIARRMMREQLKDVKIMVTQHIAVIEDDLGKKKGANNEC